VRRFVEAMGAHQGAAAAERSGRDAMVVAREVTKTYRLGLVEVHALRGLDMEIRRGEMVAVMGPSGCGKTTLLNCLSGLDEPSSGQVLVEGKDIHRMPDRQKSEYRARRIGFIFQNYNLLPVLSAQENVEMPLLVAGVPPSHARARALKTLKLVGLEKFGRHRPAELSGGQQQRVAIARSLVNDPAIVWADEPTGNLDTENSKQVMDLLCSLNQKLREAFVLVTHDPRVARRAHRIVRMENGRIVKQEMLRELGGAKPPRQAGAVGSSASASPAASAAPPAVAPQGGNAPRAPG
jgi:putative ABC transport system ATP-binding protein